MLDGRFFIQKLSCKDMIRIAVLDEPNDFDSRVRKKGLRHLEENGYSADNALESDSYNAKIWTDYLDVIAEKYQHICAYSGTRINPITGWRTVDHYLHKTGYPAYLAYDWYNYRYSCGKLNTKKGTNPLFG